MPQQQSQSSNSLSQTESQPKKGRMKRMAKKGKSSEAIGDVTLRWTSDEETLLAECFVAVFEDRNVGRSQPRDTLVSGFERIQSENFSKTYQGYVVKQMEYVEPSLPKVQQNLQTVHSVEKKVARTRPHPPVNNARKKKTKYNTSVSTGGSNSSSQFGDFMAHELRLKREAAEKAFEASKDKDRTITRLEELRFLALSTNDLYPDDAY
nr:hypothetical protein [Tanacetum cinerariifolium]